MKTNWTEDVKPTIKLLYSSALTDMSVVDTILFGAEEEGIPVEVQAVPVNNALALSIVASKLSVLGTGIGVASDQAIVHYEKLPPLKPLFTVRLDEGREAVRRVGLNGARLVKRMPLRMS